MTIEKHYRIADIPIRIIADADLIYTDERMLAPFACEPCDTAKTYTFALVHEMPEPIGECVFTSPAMVEYRTASERLRYIGAVNKNVRSAHMCVRFTENGSFVSLAGSSYTCVSAKSVLNALGMEHLAVANNSVILHASYIVSDGCAILFTAPSGTGKSTQAQLWQELRDAQIINGDRAIIKADDGRITACPLPFAGSSGICKNVTAPLKAIVYLAQAPETKIERLTGIRAFMRIWEGCCVNTWDSSDTALASKTVSDIIDRVPVYYLACTPDISAVEALERAMAERK